VSDLPEEREYRAPARDQTSQESRNIMMESVTCVVAPNTESPAARSHKIRMPVGHPQIIYTLILTPVDNLVDRHPFAAVTRQQVAGNQHFRRHPPLVVGMERVFGSRPNHLPRHVDVQDPSVGDEHLLDTLGLDRTLRPVLISAEEEVSDLELLDQLRSVRGPERSSCCEARLPRLPAAPLPLDHRADVPAYTPDHLPHGPAGILEHDHPGDGPEHPARQRRVLLLRQLPARSRVDARYQGEDDIADARRPLANLFGQLEDVLRQVEYEVQGLVRV